jgi:hypothetical protein
MPLASGELHAASTDVQDVLVLRKAASWRAVSGGDVLYDGPKNGARRQFTPCPLAVILRLREAHFLVFSGLSGGAGNFFFVFRGLHGVAGNSCFRLHGFWPGVIVSQEVAQRIGGEAIHELGMHLDQMFLGLETLFLLSK